MGDVCYEAMRSRSCALGAGFGVLPRRKAFKVVLTHTLDDEKPAILRATIYSLVRVLSIDSIAFADAKDATLVRCARLHG